MALYRRHLMEATNNQNVDIYTVEQVKVKDFFPRKLFTFLNKPIGNPNLQTYIHKFSLKQTTLTKPNVLCFFFLFIFTF